MNFATPNGRHRSRNFVPHVTESISDELSRVQILDLKIKLIFRKSLIFTLTGQCEDLAALQDPA